MLSTHCCQKLNTARAAGSACHVTSRPGRSGHDRRPAAVRCPALGASHLSAILRSHRLKSPAASIPELSHVARWFVGDISNGQISSLRVWQFPPLMALLVSSSAPEKRTAWPGYCADWTGIDWTGLDWTGLGWAGLGWAGPDWTGLDWIGLDWSGLG